MDAPQYKSIEYQFRDQRLYEDYYALFQSDGNTGPRRRSTTGIAGPLHISSVYSSIPYPVRERWSTTRRPMRSSRDRHS